MRWIAAIDGEVWQTRAHHSPSSIFRKGTTLNGSVLQLVLASVLAAGAAKVLTALKAAKAPNKLEDIILTTSGCAGMCCLEPMLTVEMKGEAPVHYVSLSDDKALQILSEHVLEGKVVSDYALGVGYERILGEEIRVGTYVDKSSEEEKSVPD